MLSWGDFLLCVVPQGPGEVGTLGQHQVLEGLLENSLPRDVERRLKAGEAGRCEEEEKRTDFFKEPRPT